MQKISLHILVLFITLSACGNASNNQGYTLKGTIKGGEGKTIYLDEFIENDVILIDSAKISSKQTFLMEGFVKEKGFYRLRLADNNFAVLVLDNQKIEVEGSYANFSQDYNTPKSTETTALKTFFGQMQANTKQLDDINQAYSNVMQTRQNEQTAPQIINLDSIKTYYFDRYNAVMKSQSALKQAFVRQHKNTILPFYAVGFFEQQEIQDNYTLLDSAYQSMKKTIPNSKYTQMMGKTVEPYKVYANLQIGKQAPEINLANPQGTLVSLSSLRGKLVLIDFWASWCGPCRQENPNVVRVYNQYKDKGFEVYGVSLDKEKTAWTKAIAQDQLRWTHVSDLKFWESEAAKTYGVRSIPQTYLIDGQGKIVAKNLRGQALEQKIAALLN